MRSILVVMVLALLAGCEKNPELLVDSDTAWKGTVTSAGGVAYDVTGGAGQRKLVLRQGARTCWALEKTTEIGYLQAYATSESLVANADQGYALTDAPFGKIAGCWK